MTDEIDRISEVVLNERQSVVKLGRHGQKKRPAAGAYAMTAGTLFRHSALRRCQMW